jgi:hypothetical protein
VRDTFPEYSRIRAGSARSVLAAESRRYDDDDVSSGCYGGSSRLMDAVVS